MDRECSKCIQRGGTCVWLLIFSVAVVGFALTAHREAWWLWRWGCLALSGVGLCGSWCVMDRPIQTIVGKPRLSHPMIRVALVACLGILAAVSYRRLLEEPAFPSVLCWFVLVAMGIGATEELLWRGWMQGALASLLGQPAAIILASASHTAYKTALFAFPHSGQAYGGLFLMASLTFSFGALLGCFRARQGTIAGPVAFHVIFDLIVYGQYGTAPWWVF